MENVVDKFIVEKLKREKDVLCIIRIGSSTYNPNSKDLDYAIIIDDIVPSPKLFEKVRKVQEEIANKFDLVPAVQGYGSSYEKKTFDIIFVSANKIAIKYLPLPPAIGVIANENYLVLFEKSKNLYEKTRKKYLETLKNLNEEIKMKNYLLISVFREVPIISYVYFILPLLLSENKEFLLWHFKISLYPFLYIRGKFPKKEDLIEELEKEYKFMKRIFKKYKITSEIFTKKEFENKNLAYALYEIIVKFTKNIPKFIKTIRD